MVAVLCHFGAILLVGGGVSSLAVQSSNCLVLIVDAACCGLSGVTAHCRLLLAACLRVDVPPYCSGCGVMVLAVSCCGVMVLAV